MFNYDFNVINKLKRTNINRKLKVHLIKRTPIINNIQHISEKYLIEDHFFKENIIYIYNT